MLFKFKIDAPPAQFSSPSSSELFASVQSTSSASSQSSPFVLPTPFRAFPDSRPPDNPVLPPEEYTFTFNTFGVDVQPVRFTPGSYHYDLALGKYTMTWASVAEMQQWVRDEEKNKTIELHRKEYRKNRTKNATTWSSKHIYVCSRQGSRSILKYTKKTARGREVPLNGS
ncbi:hypothetical protein FB451DRAFT_1169210 [Mycena latifolia]|nr:hypothetical protein FB451DRAFT_1169210 [Mycena latifolia]